MPSPSSNTGGRLGIPGEGVRAPAVPVGGAWRCDVFVVPDAADGAGDARLELGFDIAIRLRLYTAGTANTSPQVLRGRGDAADISSRREYRGTLEVERYCWKTWAFLDLARVRDLAFACPLLDSCDSS